MIWQIFEYTATIIEYIIYADFMVRFLEVKEENKRILSYFVIALLNISLTLTLNYFMFYEGLLCVFRIIMNIVITVVLLKGTLFEKIFSAITLDITALLASFMTLTFLGLLSGKTIDEMIVNRGLLRLLDLFITKVLQFEVTRIILKIKEKKRLSFEFAETLAISVIFVITLMIGLGIFRADINSGVPTDSPIYLFIGLGLIAINVFTYLLMKRISDKNLEREQLLLDKAQNELHLLQFSEYEKQYSEMRKIRHDMKNHLQCLSALISRNENDKAKDYIDDMIENKLNFGYMYIKTGNKIIDSVLNMKLAQCKKEDITAGVNIVDFDTYVEDTDMCTLLSNILDNAIEACRKESQHREIKIEIMQKKSYVNIIIKNAVSKSVLENNPKLETTKPDKQIHSIGVHSVIDIVKRYDGMIDFFEENNYFIADVWLPLKSEKTAN